MAYLGLTQGDILKVADFARTSGPSALELQVLAIAGRDRLITARSPGRLTVLSRVLFGARRVNRLADERLELLRQFALLVRHGRHDEALALASVASVSGADLWHLKYLTSFYSARRRTTLRDRLRSMIAAPLAAIEALRRMACG